MIKNDEDPRPIDAPTPRISQLEVLAEELIRLKTLAAAPADAGRSAGNSPGQALYLGAMPQGRWTVKVLRDEEWPDSRHAQRDYWLSRPASERVAAGRDFHRRVCAWFHLRGPSLERARRTCKPR